MVSAGEVDPTMIGAAVVEIGVLGFIPWHAAVVDRDSATQSGLGPSLRTAG